MPTPSTVIRADRRDHLRISEDTDFDDKRVAVLLYIPDMDEEDHDHIELNEEQARKLHTWLGKYLFLFNPIYICKDCSGTGVEVHDASCSTCPCCKGSGDHDEDISCLSARCALAASCMECGRVQDPMPAGKIEPWWCEGCNKEGRTA